MLEKSRSLWMSTTLTTSLCDALRICTVAWPACDSATPTGHSGPLWQSKQKWFFSFLPVRCVLQCPKNSAIDSSFANHGGPSLCPNFPPTTIALPVPTSVLLVVCVGLCVCVSVLSLNTNCLILNSKCLQILILKLPQIPNTPKCRKILHKNKQKLV